MHFLMIFNVECCKLYVDFNDVVLYRFSSVALSWILACIDAVVKGKNANEYLVGLTAR